MTFHHYHYYLMTFHLHENTSNESKRSIVEDRTHQRVQYPSFDATFCQDSSFFFKLVRINGGRIDDYFLFNTLFPLVQQLTQIDTKVEKWTLKETDEAPTKEQKIVTQKIKEIEKTFPQKPLMKQFFIIIPGNIFSFNYCPIGLEMLQFAALLLATGALSKVVESVPDLQSGRIQTVLGKDHGGK